VLMSTWSSLLNHVQNIHSWVDKKGKSCSCQHAPLTDEQIEWTDWVDDENDLEILKKVNIFAKLKF